jgi:hypothetical protein
MSMMASGRIAGSIKGGAVQTYIVVRRSGWPSTDALHDAAQRASQQAGSMAAHLRLVHSYVLAEHDGTIGTMCVYQASSPEALYLHAAQADLPADDIIRIVD